MAEIRLQQKQKATLSARQVLSSQLLQLPLVNLEERIYDELQENPMLELVAEPKDAAGDLPLDEPVAQEEEEPFNSLESFSEDSRRERNPSLSRDAGSGGRLHSSQGGFRQERFFQAVQHDSLTERLLGQLRLQEDVGERELAIAVEILGNLDGDGYLADTLDVILTGLSHNGIEASKAEVKHILAKIHYLDPPGLGVSDLRERLLLQLKLHEQSCAPDLYATYATAGRILGEFYEDFLYKRHDRLLKKLEVSPWHLEKSLGLITSLNPHPVEVFHDEGGHYITPDFIVTYENGELTAVLNDRSALSVKVSEAYRGVLKSRTTSKEEKQFIRYNLMRANDFATALAIRRRTLLKVIESIMKAQYAFFVYGPEQLVPLGMKAVADDAGLDISTISRAVNGKYVQTRFGVFELKYFFGSSLATENGDDMSSTVIRQHISGLIGEEDPGQPLSDDALTGMLRERGINIARRTVAKYREQMQIPVARLRKKIF